MPYTEKQVDRIDELYEIIEGHKEHEYAAPTYKDRPYLIEMAEITLSADDTDIETLENKLPALWYLTECYYKMCRAGEAVKFYKLMLETNAALMKVKEFDGDEMGRFERAFYDAVKARNYYEPDGCEDLIEIVKGSIPDGKINELFESAMESRKGLPKYDPVEKTEEYLAVIDEVEELIDKNKTMDFCLEYWNLKGEYLHERGIHWRSPSMLNPHIMFD